MASPTYFTRDGKLWRRSEQFPEGCYLDPQAARNLLVLYEAALWSKHLADELRAAIKTFDLEHADVHA